MLVQWCRGSAFLLCVLLHSATMFILHCFYGKIIHLKLDCMNELKSEEIKWKIIDYINVKEYHTSIQAFSSSYRLGLNILLLLSLHTVML